MNRTLSAAFALLLAVAAHAQSPASPQPTTPTGESVAKTAPSPDAPSVRVGGTLFMDYTFNDEPEIRDAAGNLVQGDTFNVSRTYLNITGNLNRRINFRITPDIVRESGSGSSLNGSYTYRLKFAYAQLNLDEWFTQGSWLRAGLHQTPYLETIESVYRYRFQGPTFTDREGFLISSDFGVSGRYVLPSEYGDVQAGVYNGEGFQRSEQNDQKALMARITIRPMPGAAIGKGLRVGLFYDDDHYFRGAARRRISPFVLFEHARVNAGFEYLQATDRSTAAATEVEASGFSVWVVPRLTKSIDLLLRHDSLNPDENFREQKKTRDIAGVAYWIPKLQRVTSAVMLDAERVQYDSIDRADETRYAVHFLLTF